jgi:hypothetical protein
MNSSSLLKIKLTLLYTFQGKRRNRRQISVDMPPDEYERHPTINQPADRDDEMNNRELFARDLVPQGLLNPDNPIARSQYIEAQQNKVQFASNNNFFKNVTENKDISKLVAQLATCINATKKVRIKQFFDFHSECFIR